MRRILSAILILLSIAVVAVAQTETRLKLTRQQREQLSVYQKISQLVRQGKTDQKQFFKAYYKFINDSNKLMEELNRQEALKLNDRANKALNSRKPELAQRLNAGAKMYMAMAEINKKICEAYDSGSVGDMTRQLDSYIELEAQMQKVGAKPYPREWYTTKEAEQVLKLMAQAQRK
ncbi:MAG: hypothetical protein ACOX6W_14895 [Lentisphaeria bacterium]|jgi:hypothetical protein